MFLQLCMLSLAQGLGMRVVGGRAGPGGSLGAYVTVVTKGGPADTQGITEGIYRNYLMFSDAKNNFGEK